MRALIRRNGGVDVDEVEAPRVRREDDVLVQVVIGGICRTDAYVARGRLAVAEPRILGHEFAGLVLRAGSQSGFAPGERVTVAPAIPCGACSPCRAGAPCAAPLFLGLDLDGAFAERIVVPSAQVLRVPPTMPLRLAAYVEPVAAALAVLRAPISATDRGLLLGDNRIAGLVGRVLETEGFREVAAASVGAAPDEPAAFDFVIETEATRESLAAMVHLLKPGAVGVLKSRPAMAVPLDVTQAVKKDIRFYAVNYGSFERAIALLASGALRVDDLLGGVYRLDDWERALSAAEAPKALKQFLAIADEAECEAVALRQGELADAALAGDHGRR